MNNNVIDISDVISNKNKKKHETGIEISEYVKNIKDTLNRIDKSMNDNSSIDNTIYTVYDKALIGINIESLVDCILVEATLRASLSLNGITAYSQKLDISMDKLITEELPKLYNLINNNYDINTDKIKDVISGSVISILYDNVKFNIVSISDNGKIKLKSDDGLSATMEIEDILSNQVELLNKNN